MSLCCQRDERRDAVRRMNGWNGLDYVEVSEDQLTLHVFFLGKLPEELLENRPGIERYLRLEGGERVTDIRIRDINPIVDPDPAKDDCLVVKLDKYGDFSTYTLRLVGVANIDPHYDHVDFSFKVGCPSDLDCAPECTCEPSVPPEPEINYLAKDYASFRQLILDRLAVLLPDWTERHVPDLGITLAELLAYAADYLSYYQDAVATEAYLDTARQRVSVRRHVRLVDYLLHEGCNARAWVALQVSADLTLDQDDVMFATGLNDALTAQQTVLSWDALQEIPSQTYEVFEPLLLNGPAPIRLYSAHNELHFYTWGAKECCLERGSTAATLLDSWESAAESPEDKDTPQHDQLPQDDLVIPKNAERLRTLRKLKPGDVLIFEEVVGPRTGLPADADPARRHAVRLTRVTPRVDPIVKGNGGEPTPYVRIEWAPEDALPFPFCISTIGEPPGCKYIDNVSVARGNVILADHGETQDPEDLGEVPTESTDAVCECADHPSDIRYIPGRFAPRLTRAPLTFAAPLPPDEPGRPSPATGLLDQDVRASLPQLWLSSQPEETWEPRSDLIASGPDDRHFVVEIDNDGIAALRFGDGELGYQPPAGMVFSAVYRIGNGTSGNVGAESISRLVLKTTTLSGVSVTVRNPLPAHGGTAPELTAEAKLAAPHWFRQNIERAITAQDYEEITERNLKIQNASAVLVWTGSWYEADVAVDPYGRDRASPGLLREIAGHLYRFRRMGHDLHLEPATYVPLDLKLEVCVLPNYQSGHVKAELLDVFSNRLLSGGQRGFFHVDNLTFGEGVYLSKIIAEAQAVAGVVSVRVTRFQRQFEAPNHEIENGVLPLSMSEIARLDNDPNYPEHGKLEIQVGGGR